MRWLGLLAVCLLALAPSLAAGDDLIVAAATGEVSAADPGDFAAADSGDSTAENPGDSAAAGEGESDAPADGDGADASERHYTKGQQCKRLMRQIDHFENTVLPMAESRGDALWAASTEAHIDRLEGQLAGRCPQYAKQRGAFAAAKAQAEELRQLMILAARGAAKYFTGGWF